MNGLLGSILCTLGVVLPAFIIMFIISLYFDQFLKLKYISYAFKGIQIGVIYLILRAGIRFYKNLDKSLFNIIIISLVMFFMILFSLLSINFSSIYFILICGFIGMIILNKKEVK
jgi:chromate transporter